MQEYLIFKCHIDKDRLIYVTSFDSEVKAKRFVECKNKRSIREEVEDTMYNYYYMKNLWFECVRC